MLLLDYQKSVQPFSFLHILLKNDKIIAQILQRQCLLFGEIVSITVENGSELVLTLRQLEHISPPLAQSRTWKARHCGSNSENSLVNLYRAKYEPCLLRVCC